MVVCDNGSGLVRHRNLVSSWYTIYVYLYMCMYLQQANACTRYMYTNLCSQEGRNYKLSGQSKVLF